MINIPEFNNIENLTLLQDIKEELDLVQDFLFNLKIRKNSENLKKNHLFKHLKKRIAQLKYKYSIIYKLEKIINNEQ